MYNPAWERGHARKKMFKGRGKYERTLHQYFFDAYKGRERVGGGIAFGYRDLMRQRGNLRKLLGGGYRIKVYNNTRKKWLLGG